MDTEVKLILALTATLITGIIAGVCGCAIDAQRDQFFAQHGYSQTVLPGSAVALWVKCPTNEVAHGR